MDFVHVDNHSHRKPKRAITRHTCGCGIIGTKYTLAIISFFHDLFFPHGKPFFKCVSLRVVMLIEKMKLVIPLSNKVSLYFVEIPRLNATAAPGKKVNVPFISL